ncbi:MAG: hypothetical protein RLZZ618_1760 [Pseudomonadota bacterium]|jgi:hypothetical protein
MVLIAALTSGCTAMLPRARSEIASPFESFEAARDAFETIVPYSTTITQMTDRGFDVRALANVKQIPYPELVGRLAPNSGVALELLDAGIRDCILARQACRAYEFTMSRQSLQREGNFLLDFLSFRRTTRTTGWRFEGLVVVRDDLVLFRNHGGEPKVERVDSQTNPLGPFQQAGEAVGGLIKP